MNFDHWEELSDMNDHDDWKDRSQGAIRAEWRNLLDYHGFVDWSVSDDGGIFYRPDECCVVEAFGQCACGKESPLPQILRTLLTEVR